MLERGHPWMLYLITAGAFVKVGVSTDIGGRLAAMQTGCPLPLGLLLAVQLSAGRSPHIVERNIHADLKWAGLHVRGEWFKGCATLWNLASRHLYHRCVGPAVPYGVAEALADWMVLDCNDLGSAADWLLRKEE